MSSIVVSGDTSGAVTLSAPAVAGTVTVTLPSASGTMASLASVTANGVSYVNSSGQPTSGSALVFDATNLSLGTVGAKLNFATTSSATVNYIGGSADGFSLEMVTQRGALQPLTYKQDYGSGHIWSITGSEVFRATSTSLYTASTINVGIGTSSPTQKLTVVSTSGTYGTAYQPIMQIGNTSSGGTVGDPTGLGAIVWSTDGTATLTASIEAVRENPGAGAASALYFRTGSSGGGTTQAVIDSSGNLGLGVTPSAWSTSAQKALQVYLSGVSSSGGGNTASRFTHGCYLDGSTWKYKDTGVAPTRYEVTGANGGSTHSWSIAAGGTAGNAITFTQAMTLDASGRLLLGTTSAGSNQGLTVYDATQGEIRLQNSTTGNTAADGFQIAVSGSNAFLYNRENAALLFGTNDTERARIDSSGNLLVGVTSPTLSTNTFFKAAGASNPVLYLFKNSAANTDEAFCIANGTGGGTLSFQVLANGNAQNTNNSYGAISDVKLKENIVDASPKLADLMQVKVRHYNFKSNPDHKQIGVVAQELEQVFPAMVEETVDSDLKGNGLGTTTKSVKYSVFVPMLIKAIQEQQVFITQLTARITALEGAA